MSLLRKLEPHQHARVGFIELFFDLVFVFAITQLSHHLIAHYSLLGAFQTLILFMAVWWAWIDTAWVTNWLDPQKHSVRLMLLVLMFAGLVLSTSLPEAFGERGIYFAGAYAFIQVGRALFTLFALKGHDETNYRNFQRICIWFATFSTIWIIGAFTEGEVRLAIWTFAVIFEVCGPAAGFYIPGLGRSATADWTVEGAHMAERCGLFIIIALGESILVTGATFAELEWNATNATAFVVAFIGSIAMWWIYFDTSHERGSEHITRAPDPGRIARLAYTYLHLPIVAGIVVSAVGDEISILHPHDHGGIGVALAIMGGPALYLTGTALFRRTVVGRWPWSHIGGIAALLLGFVGASELSPLAMAVRAMVILVIVAAVEGLIVRVLARPRP